MENFKNEAKAFISKLLKIEEKFQPITVKVWTENPELKEVVSTRIGLESASASIEDIRESNEKHGLQFTDEHILKDQLTYFEKHKPRALELIAEYL